MISNRSVINQVIKIDDATIEKLKGVDGNIYIYNHNSGSNCTKIETTESRLAECLIDLLDEHECSYKEILSIVHRAMIEYAYSKHGNLHAAAEYLGYQNPASIRHIVKPIKSGLKFLNTFKKVRSLPIIR